MASSKVGHHDQHTFLLSVKPGYANLLVDGIKTVELRRKFPVDVTPGTRCLIYASSPVKRIIGEVSVGSVDRLPLRKLWAQHGRAAMISWEDFAEYFAGTEVGYGISVYGHVRYERPFALANLKGNIGAPQSYRYLPSSSIPAIL